MTAKTRLIAKQMAEMLEEDPDLSLQPYQREALKQMLSDKRLVLMFPRRKRWPL